MMRPSEKKVCLTIMSLFCMKWRVDIAMLSGVIKTCMDVKQQILINFSGTA